jgi:hypothetical protein
MITNNNIRGDVEMKNKVSKPCHLRTKNGGTRTPQDDLFEHCIRKGLIEKTPYGYYFKPEFFETLEVYET